MTQTRVEVLQLLFISGEIEHLISAAKHLGELIIEGNTNGKFMPSFLFEHTYTFNYDDLCIFSNALSELSTSESESFKKILHNITYRIVKRIAIRKAELSSLSIDMNQVKINLTITDIPFKQHSTLTINKLETFNSFVRIKGHIVETEPIKKKVIRMLYKCQNAACSNLTYLKKEEKFEPRKLMCKFCGSMLEPDEKGNITTPTINIFLHIDKTNAFKPMKVTVTGKEDIDKLMKMNLTKGDHVSVVGILGFDEGFQPQIKAMTFDKLILINTNESNAQSAQRIVACDDFNEFLSFIDSYYPRRIFCNYYRFIVVSFISIVTESKVLFIVNTLDEHNFVVKLLQSLTEHSITLYPSQQLPALLQLEHQNCCIIPHFELLTKQQKDAIISNMTKVKNTNPIFCVFLNSVCESKSKKYQQQTYDTESFSIFDLIVRSNVSSEDAFSFFYGK